VNRGDQAEALHEHDEDIMVSNPDEISWERIDGWFQLNQN
jgi:hypothetical protein